jgi:hypothetical protein
MHSTDDERPPAAQDGPKHQQLQYLELLALGDEACADVEVMHVSPVPLHRVRLVFYRVV